MKSLIDLFADIRIIDDEGESHSVPIKQIQDTTEAWFETEEQINVPSMSLVDYGKKYVLIVCTDYQEHMNMIVEQVMMKFVNDGINKETACPVKLVSITNNFSDKTLKTYRYNFDLEEADE